MRLLGEPGDKTPGRAWGRGSRESLGTRLPGEPGDKTPGRVWGRGPQESLGIRLPGEPENEAPGTQTNYNLYLCSPG